MPRLSLCSHCGRLHPDHRRNTCTACRNPRGYNTSEYRALRAQLLNQPDAHCADCGAITDLTVDHRIPLARGGTNHPSNVQVLCRPCNSRKADA